MKTTFIQNVNSLAVNIDSIVALKERAISIADNMQKLQSIYLSLQKIDIVAGNIETYDAIASKTLLYENIYNNSDEILAIYQNLSAILETADKALQVHEDAQSASSHAGNAFLSATASKTHEEKAAQALKDAIYQVTLAAQQAINAKGWYTEAKAQAEKARLSEQGAMSSYAESEILEKIVRDNLAKTQTFAQEAQNSSEFSAEVLETSSTYKDLALSAKDTIMSYFLNISSMLERVQEFNTITSANATLSTTKATVATEQATIATQKATLATQKADIATTQAELATQKASAAASSATDASLFASQAAITAGIYDTVANGLSHTTTSQFFSVQGGVGADVYVSLYQNVAGTAVLVNTIFSSEKITKGFTELETLIKHVDFAVRTSLKGEIAKEVGSVDYLNKTALVYELHKSGIAY